MDIKAYIQARTRELGFHDVGFARAEPLPDEHRAMARWLARGDHAGMEYLERYDEVRLDPAHPGMLAGARTVVSVAMAYPWRDVSEGGVTPSLARFARGRDYHQVLRSGLKTLMAELRRSDPSLRGRALVDTAPLFERAWAVRAGLGWIGRNTCLIHPELGSALVLGELVLTAELEPDQPMDDRCGSCRACLDACPTGALARRRGRRLDARKCLSYWTVEAREPTPDRLAARSDILFGCDACQDACPWNRRRDLPPEPDAPLAPLPRWRSISLEDLAAMADDELRELLKGTTLKRAGVEKIRRRARALLRRSPKDAP